MDLDTLFAFINEWDPIGLIMMSAPENEYAPEVEMIWENLGPEMSVADIAQVIDDTFHYFFNNNNPHAKTYERDFESLEELARKIHALL